MDLDILKTKLGGFPIRYMESSVEELNKAYSEFSSRNNSVHINLEKTIKKACKNIKYFLHEKTGDEYSWYGLAIIELMFGKKIEIKFPWKGGKIEVYTNKRIKNKKINKYLGKIINELNKAKFAWYEN